MESKNTLRVFTAFSGYDSQCLALERLKANNPGFDYELVGWSEIDKYAIQAHNVLFPQWSDRNFGDIAEIDWGVVPDFDLFTYSSPCQDFSLAGKQAGGEKGSGTRSSLLWECEKAITIRRPKYLLFENVDALVNKNNISLFWRWQTVLQKLDYKNFVKVLNAKNYGVPQNRKRVYMVSVLGEAFYSFPKQIRLERELIDLLEPVVDEKYFLTEDRMKSILSHVTRKRLEGCNFNVNITDGHGISNTITDPGKMRETDTFVLGWTRDKKGKIIDRHPVAVANTVTAQKRDNTQNYVVLNTTKAGIARTLTTDMAKYCGSKIINPTGGRKQLGVVMRVGGKVRVRRFTPKECFRLMGVSESDIDTLLSAKISDTQLYKMAGNSIVVNVLECILDKLFCHTEIIELTLF